MKFKILYESYDDKGTYGFLTKSSFSDFKKVTKKLVALLDKYDEVIDELEAKADSEGAQELLEKNAYYNSLIKAYSNSYETILSLDNAFKNNYIRVDTFHPSDEVVVDLSIYKVDDLYDLLYNLQDTLSKSNNFNEGLNTEMKFLVENELEKRHKKHKKAIKPGAIGSFIHPDGGNQVAIDTFNNSVDMSNISSSSSLGEALNESYDSKFKDIINYIKSILPENTYFSYDDYRVIPDDMGSGMRFQVEFDSKDSSLQDKVINSIERKFYGVTADKGWGRDWDYYITIKVDDRACNESFLAGISESYVLDSEADWALDHKLVRTDLYTRVYGGKLSPVFKSELDGSLYALEYEPDLEGYRYVGTFPEYCEKVTPEVKQLMLAQRQFESHQKSSSPLSKELNEDYVEDKLKRLISVQTFISPHDDIQLFTTEKGNYLVKRNGKQLMILDKKNFRESEIEDLRLNGYFRDYDKMRMNEGMSRLELMKQNKKRYADLEKQISNMKDGLEKDVCKYLGLRFIKGRNWEGGLGGGKDIDNIYQKLMDKYSVDFETVDDIFTKNFIKESLTEDTIKQDGKWVNKGKEGTHGKFNTKKEADAQRRAMFANGYKESLQEEVEEDNMNSIKEKVIKAIQDEWKTIAYYNDLIEELKKIDDLDGINVINDINNEEHIHVGQLQSLLQTMDGDIEAIHQGNEEGDEQLTESLKEQEDKINDFIEHSRGYSDYNQIIENVADEFDLSKEDAEQYVWNYMYTIGHDVNNIYDESLNEDNPLYALRNFKKYAHNGDELKIDINGNKGEVSKEADGWYLYYGGLVTQGSYKIIEAAVKDAVMRAEAKKSMQESFDPYSLQGYNYDDHEIEVGINYCKENNIDVNSLNDYDFENIVILANKYYASKPDWKYTDDEILAGLNLLYDEGAMLSNLDADGVEYYIKKANNIEECYKMTNKEIKEALNKLDMWAIDNDATFHDLKTLYEAFVNPHAPVDQKKKEKIQKALNDPTMNKDKEKLQDYIAGILSRQDESLNEDVEAEVIIPAPYDKYFEVEDISYMDDYIDDSDYKIGDKIDGYDATLLAYLIPKHEKVEEIYPVLTDDPDYPVCELIGGRLIPVEV